MTDATEHAVFLKRFLASRHEIQAFIRAAVRDRAAAEDIFQEVSIVLWEKFDSYDQGRPFAAWARGIASNKILQFWRRSSKQPIPHSPEAMASMLSACERTETDANDMIDALANCVQRLPAHQAGLLRMKYEEGLKLETISGRLGKSLAATQKALSRLRFALRDCVGKRLAEEGL